MTKDVSRFRICPMHRLLSWHIGQALQEVPLFFEFWCVQYLNARNIRILFAPHPPERQDILTLTRTDRRWKQHGDHRNRS